MKKVILAGVVAVMFGANLNAQEMRRLKDRPDKQERLLKMQERLELSDAQVVKIKALDTQFLEEEKALEAKRKALHKEHEALRARKEAELEQILSPEQLEKMKNWKHKRKERLQQSTDKRRLMRPTK